MGRDSIVSDAERNRKKDSEQAERSDSAENESESSSNERVRVTQRLPAELAEEIDEIQNQYNLSSRNATINFILTHGINHLQS